MRIDGREIAKGIFKDLKKRVDKLKEKSVTPHLVVFLIGDDPASSTYVRQKELKTIEIGAKVTTYNLGSGIQNSELLKLIKKVNNNNTVHGIIVQRPLPAHVNKQEIDLAINPKKDIDSFHPKSPFPMPLAAAVLKILEEVFYKISHPRISSPDSLPTSHPHFLNWLKSKKITVIGKGKTGGGPTIQMFRKMGIKPEIIDSKTANPKTVTKNADILISTVGKPNIVKADMIKKGTVLISVGLHKGKDGKLRGDYEEDEIKNIASFYTPTPGGIGPVNVAMLLENLVNAAESAKK